MDAVANPLATRRHALQRGVAPQNCGAGEKYDGQKTDTDPQHALKTRVAGSGDKR
jgi:hypothetical protein